jgi:putative transposase
MSSYYRHRFPSETISHCVWLYFRFSPSFRDVEEMVNERGVTVTYESVREWSLRFGGTYAKRMRSRSPGGNRANGLMVSNPIQNSRKQAG